MRRDVETQESRISEAFDELAIKVCGRDRVAGLAFARGMCSR